MGVMPINKLILNMSLPMMASMLVQALYNIVDSVFVSFIDQDTLTAVGLVFPAQNLMIGLASGAAVGVNALLSRALGAGERERASRVAENGIFLAAVCYLLTLVTLLFTARGFLASQTQVTYIIDQGYTYLMIVGCGSAGIFGQIMFERLLQSTGRTVLSMYSQLLGAVINLALDPILIFACDLGIAGAAIATIAGQLVGCAFGLYLNMKKNPDITLRLKRFRPDGEIIRGICAIGVPSFIMVAIGSVMTFGMNKLLILYHSGRETAATVFGVYFKLNSFVFMPIFGLNGGVVPIVAYNYGAQKRRRVTQTVKLSAVYASALMIVGMIVFMAIPDKLLLIFNAEGEMLTLGIPALRIICSSFLFAGVCIGISSTFQAFGKGSYSMILSIARQLVVLLPAAYVLARIGAATGNDDLVWYSYPIAEVASLIVTLVLYARLYKNVISTLPLED